MHSTKHIQPFVQAYLVYEDSVFLVKRRLWVPIGGHLVRGGREPLSMNDVRNPLSLLEGLVGETVDADGYHLYSNAGFYLVNQYVSLSPRGRIHFNTVYFGGFKHQPRTVEGSAELFDEKKLARESSQLGNKVLEFSSMALRFASLNP